MAVKSDDVFECYLIMVVGSEVDGFKGLIKPDEGSRCPLKRMKLVGGVWEGEGTFGVGPCGFLGTV